MISPAPLTVAELNATLFGTSEARTVPTDTIIKAMLDVGTGISDLTPLVAKLRSLRQAGKYAEAKSLLPPERVYPVDAATAKRLGMTA